MNKAVGGTSASQHTQGLAADFICPQFGMPRSVASYLLDHSTLRFDQMIWEGQWVHISFVATNPRRQVLTAHFTAAGVSYTPGIPDRRAS